MNGDPLLLIIPDLPQNLRERLLVSLKAACPGYMEWTDSEFKKNSFEFLALHFCWWNRYSTSVRLMFLFHQIYFLGTYENLFNREKTHHLVQSLQL